MCRPDGLPPFSPDQQPFNGNICPWCGSRRTWCFHHWNDNYFRGNGVEVDKSEWVELCTHCRRFFRTRAGFPDREANGVFPVDQAGGLSGQYREALERFLATGQVTLDERE